MNGLAQFVLDDYQDRLDGEAIGYLRRIQGNAMLMAQRPMDVVVHDGMWGRIDPALAHILLENLIGNAWKFTGKVTAPRGVGGGATFFFTLSSEA